tara:strand:+ start:33 stop:506 length:474 start_codon:yes stop_codon:yes gene_type:complete
MEDTMCKQLDNIQSLIDNLNVEDLLNDFIPYKKFRYYKDRTTKKIWPEGNDKTKARHKHGVYSKEIDNFSGIKYFGKGEQSTIADRIASHKTNFHTNNGNESSGNKILDFINDNNLEYVDIMIKYLDLTKYSKDMIPMIERKLIDAKNPQFNRESTI